MALCQSSKANMERQNSQKFDLKKSFENTSVIRLSSSASSGVITSSASSIAALSLSVNLPSVCAFSPCRQVTRTGEELGSSRFRR